MPLTVAVVGASPDRTKYGNKAVRAYLQQGHTVYPVHPREPIVEGLAAYPTVADIPTDHLDRVTMYVPPQIGLQVVESLGGQVHRRGLVQPRLRERSPGAARA
jgi:predicted CoA-binding protein